jgi:hypothetical protein
MPNKASLFKRNMPNQTSASDYTNFTKLNTNLASSRFSAKPNLQLANRPPESLIGPINLGTVLQTQADKTKHYVTTATLLKWHR